MKEPDAQNDDESIVKYKETETEKININDEQNDSSPSLASTDQNDANTKNKTLSFRQQKKKLRAEQRKERVKELKSKKKADNYKHNNIGFNSDNFEETEYYFENGLRKVYPYTFVFSCYTKGRWLNRKVGEVIGSEFGVDSDDELENAFKEGRITVNNRRVSEDYKLKNNDFLSHKIHRHENPVSAAPIEIIADTEHVLVVNKPSSIPCHPCGRYRYNSMQYILKKEYGYKNLATTHRLDRLTSGVLIFSKTYEQAVQFKELLTERKMEKEYVCRVEGEFPEGDIVVDQPLEALWHKVRLQIVSPKGKQSCTHFKRLSFNGRSSVVRCYPKTGRTHQIRVHLQYLGHPIVNDYFYNSAAWGANGGKGGDYGVGFEELCQRITKEHMATVWDEGENPFYVQQFGDQQASDDTENTCLLDTQEKPSCSDEPALKKAKIDNDDGTNHTVNEVDATDPAMTTNNLNSSSSSSNDLLNSDKSQTSSCLNQINTTPSTNDCGNTNSEIKPHLPFDKNKMILERNCSSCKRNSLDPAEKNLTMFLHACMYKGSDWKYETGLPDWAQPDWCREDDFVLKYTQRHNYPNDVVRVCATEICN